jgi:hypothetical protein
MNVVQQEAAAMSGSAIARLRAIRWVGGKAAVAYKSA